MANKVENGGSGEEPKLHQVADRSCPYLVSLGINQLGPERKFMVMLV